MKKGVLFVIVLFFSLLVTSVISASGGPVGNRFTISNDPGLEELSAAVAYNPNLQEYLTIWHNDRPGNDDIQAQRIASDGRLLGGRFYIAAGPGADRRFPDAAYDSQSHEYLAVWEHYDQASGSFWIQGQRISDMGSLIGSVITICNVGVSSHAPAVAYASTANQYLIVWSWDSGGLMHIMGKTYSPGSGLSPMFYVFKDTVGGLHMKPDLAYNRARNEFLVVWQEFTAGWMEIYGARVKMSGGPGVLGAPIGLSLGMAGDKTHPAVAALPNPAGLGQYLVAWEDDSTLSDRNLMVRYVDGNGNMPIGIVVLANSPWDEYSPALAASESRDEFLATWTWTPAPTPPGMMQVRAIAIPRTGPWSAPSMIVGGGQVFDSAVTAGPNGDYLVAFDDNEIIGVANRGIYGHLWGDRLYLPIMLK